MTTTTAAQTNRNVIFLVIVASLGYFVDIYDLLIFSIVRVESLKGIGITNPDEITSSGTFIITDDGKDLFVHFKDVQGGVNAIKDNDSVQYDVEEGRKGLQAVNVKKI